MQNISDRKRLFKRAGFSISELGLGAWGIGGKNVGSITKIEARDTILAYVEAGGNFIDTAGGYGESEVIIGNALKETGLSGSVFIATKSKSGEEAETVKGLRKDLEASLRNLQRETIDLFYLHRPPEDDEVMDRALSELEKFRKEGKIRAIGASIKGPYVTDATVDLCKKYIDTGRIDAIQMVYSILRQKNIESMRYAYENDVGIIGRTSLESGFLSGKYPVGTRFASDDHRRRWNGRIDEILGNVESIKRKYVGDPYENISQLAIKFALAPKQVTSVIVGAKNVAQVESNIKASLLDAVDTELLNDLINEYGGLTEYSNPKPEE